ncbi:putative cytochrome P450 [Astrocystis sublimbata]|nr:putative cytochrome P450 [Astrocystis sublimbata]
MDCSMVLLIFLLGLLVYCVFDGLLTIVLIAKLPGKPFVGSRFQLTPRFLLNLSFAIDALKVVERGYRRFADTAFQIIRNDEHLIVLPLSVLEELSIIPASVASPNNALEHDLLGRYTGLNLILESRAHHFIVQRRLTPRLGVLAPRLAQEIECACDENLTTSREWVEFQPYQVLSKVSARLAAQAIVPRDLASNPKWLELSVEYTENLFKTVVLARLFPSWTHRFVCYLLPSYWKGQGYMRTAKQLLGPRIRELLQANDAGIWKPESGEDDANILNWLVDMAKGRDRDADTIAHVEVLVALAAVHTTLLRMVNVLYDVTQAGPTLIDELRAEIQSVDRHTETWDKSAYEKLHKLDSVLCESQRLSPPTTLGMKRIFREDYTFENGLHIPKGAYVAMPIHAIENDPKHTNDPTAFDGLRKYRLMKERQAEDSDADTSQFRFSTPTRTSLNFGYGRHACPGRHFASLALKMLFVKLLSEYDFSFLPGSEKPQNLMAHEFLFTNPWDSMLIKKRTLDQTLTGALKQEILVVS